MKNLILASSSARREEILKRLNLQFTVVPSKIDESGYDHLTPEKMVQKLSALKAKEVSKLVEDTLIIAADTIIVNNDKVLGKPQSKEDAAEMLKKLRGENHTVMTGLAVYSTGDSKEITDIDRTEVYMTNMSDDEIAKYVSTGEPMGKAGSYAIQGLGSVFVEKIEGSYFTVMGLPVHKLAEILNEFSINII
ncbi:MAG: Maf family protein [Bacillota bacterium]